MIRVVRSSVINAPAEQVWAKIRDFNGMPGWHPGITESVIEGGAAADKVGCVRSIKLAIGATIRERLVALDDRERCYTYVIVEIPLPIQNYVATIKATPITDGNRTYIDWVAEFDCPPGQEAEFAALVGDSTYQAGFDALKQLFG